MHLEADLLETVKWADAAGRRWAFTLSNAGARYTEFRNSLEHLDEIDWAAVRARDFRDPHKETQDRFERVVSLVEGFETPVGLELLATVHWLMTEERFKEPSDLVRAVHEWAPGKRQFTTAQIELASGRLHSEGWL